MVGGGVDPTPITTSAGSFAVVDRLVRMSVGQDRFGPQPIGFLGPQFGPCMVRPLNVPILVAAGDTGSIRAGFDDRSLIEGCDYVRFNGQFAKWYFDDRYTFQSPIRRKSTDGSEYDASPMAITRNGVPWMTYYWGYRLGLVASASNWLDTSLAAVPDLRDWPTLPNSRDNFELVKLPPPIVDGEVVEYVNKKDFPMQPGGQFFMPQRRLTYRGNDCHRLGRRGGRDVCGAIRCGCAEMT